MSVTIALDQIDLGPNETLIVCRHRKTGKWWAVIGPERGQQRAIGEGDTPIAALGELLLDLGIHPKNSN